MLMTETAAPAAARPARIPRWLAYAAAVVAGGLLLVSFPPYGLWFCAPVGVALLACAVRGRGVWGGLGFGWIAGVVLFVPLLSWTGTQVGWWPWILLANLEAAYIGLLGAAAAFATPLFLRYRWTWPLMTALLWTAQEYARSRTPFGGFPWGRLAFSQADAPTVRYAVLAGAPLVTLVVALAGGLLAFAAWHLASFRQAPAPGRVRPGVLPALLADLGAVAVIAAGALIPLVAPGEGRAVDIAIVQGNVPRLGLDFNEQRRAVLDNHVSATLELAAKVDRHEIRRPALVVWPENSSDIDPYVNADAYEAIDRAARTIGAPILVGAVLAPDDGHVRNTGVLWIAGQGPQQQYTKRHPVPFAEFIPMRPLVRKITKKVDLVRSDFLAGDRPGLITVPAEGGSFPVGDVICFEVAYDDIVRDTVTGGARLLVVQTNNATFNTAEALQQLSMVRLRSVEHGRPGLMASTVGVSAFVSPDGRAYDATTFNTRAALVRQTHLTVVKTPATTLGGTPEAVLAGLALFGLVMAGFVRRRARVQHTDEEEA
ncbi:apolipoprotein N-acyltransferase [Longispora fulva]|uniref:Apolipoprotein N-acyltransferase n=2 Tax=Longispora fulva TaxID=619741 RepID=A0A8J7GIP6_9ACTN|nr:apolipoprotein N-acyltransferase [Longispora fulva]